MIREFTLQNAYQRNRLRVEDRCGIMRLAASCDDMKLAVGAIYETAGR